MFFGSLDSSNFITVDKPPASLWVMALSGRIFGFGSWSMLVPQALEGVAAVALLYAAIKRWFGAGAGLLAGALLAITPVAALMFRFNNPDALLVCLLVASAYCLTRAIEQAGTKWVIAAGTMIGLAFLAKMMQAFLVLPAFGLVYLVAAPTGLRRRLAQLLAGALAIVVSCGWWVAIVALWPASSRPYHRRLARQQHLQPDLRLQRPRPDLRLQRPGRRRRWRRRWRHELQRRDRAAAAVRRPDGRAGLLAAARRAARARRRPVALPPRAPHRPHPRGAVAVGRLAARHRGDLQLRPGRDPHLLHGRPRPGDRRADRDRGLCPVAGPRDGRREAHRGARGAGHGRLVICAARPHAALGILAAPADRRERAARGGRPARGARAGPARAPRAGRRRGRVRAAGLSGRAGRLFGADDHDRAHRIDPLRGAG